eukprot:7389092-Prymnesium_polylepis.2
MYAPSTRSFCWYATECMVRALTSLIPINEVSRAAAWPVGAAAHTEMPRLTRNRASTPSTCDLPRPGPPVSATTRCFASRLNRVRCVVSSIA